MTETQAIRPSLWCWHFHNDFLVVVLAFVLMVTEIRRVGSSMAYADVPGEMDVDLKQNLSYTVFLEQRREEARITPMIALKSRCAASFALPGATQSP